MSMAWLHQLDFERNLAVVNQIQSFLDSMQMNPHIGNFSFMHSLSLQQYINLILPLKWNRQQQLCCMLAFDANRSIFFSPSIAFRRIVPKPVFNAFLIDGQKMPLGVDLMVFFPLSFTISPTVKKETSFLYVAFSLCVCVLLLLLLRVFFLPAEG